MKMLKMTALAAMLFTLGSAGNQALAGEMVVHAQFGFTAGEILFPAGDYRVESYLPTRILIRNTETGKGAIVPILARLNGREEGGAQVVFSKEGDQYFLSAVYLPAMDGFRLKAATGSQHNVTLAQNAR
jgi:hypothetical protein